MSVVDIDMEWYEADIRELEARVKNIDAACPAVFYGSSSIRMWDTLSKDLAYPGAVNAGFGGSTLEACVYFFDRVIPPLHPASLVVYAGDNDLGDGKSPEQVLTSFRALALMVERKLGPIPFGYISVKASPARFGIIDRIRRTNDLIRAEIANIPSAYWIDVFTAMLNQAGKPRPELFQDDGLHLNRQGYKVWADRLAPYRNQIVIADCRNIDAGRLSLQKA
jgi:lysophospholipase L1-like esterase